jgi:adenosylcobinamide-GDP ribazoletransferase
MKKLFLAFQFLTIVPLKDIGKVPEQEVGNAAVFFPLVGLFEGILFLILSILLLKVFPPELTNGLLVLVMVLMNGGLHIDGLSDTFDAVASRGDSEKKLVIMKASTVGPAGVTSIVLSLLLKYLLLNTLFFHTTLTAYNSLLLLFPVVSRWTMVTAIFHGKPARQDGLGRMFIEHTGLKELLAATIATILICALALTLTSGIHLLSFHLMFVLPALYIFSFAAVLFFHKNFGGMTGDSFGAVYEIAVLLYLAIGTIWQLKFI